MELLKCNKCPNHHFGGIHKEYVPVDKVPRGLTHCVWCDGKLGAGELNLHPECITKVRNLRAYMERAVK